MDINFAGVNLGESRSQFNNAGVNFETGYDTNDHDFADWFVEEFGTDPSTAYLRVENWDPLVQAGLLQTGSSAT